jgi:hypothetical protein
MEIPEVIVVEDERDAGEEMPGRDSVEWVKVSRVEV